MSAVNTYQSLLAELAELRAQLQEANDTIDAIRNGSVDALIVKSGKQHQLYTLTSADHTYRAFIEQMKEGAVTLTADGIVLYSNSQFASRLDMPLTEIIGAPITDFIHPKCQLTFERIIEQGWQTESREEITFRDKNNKLIPFLVSVTRLDLEEGKSLSVILTDLTLQKKNEKLLRLKNKALVHARGQMARMNEALEDIVKDRTKDLLVSREYFRFLADNIPVIVWTAKADGFADYFNKKWYEYTGLSLEDSEGSGSQQALHPDDAERIKTAWENAIESQSAFHFEYRIKRAADGEYCWHLGKGEPVKDETGALIAWFGTATEIEDQKKELENKDEFIGIASHELKTPLTSVKGYIQLIGEQTNLPNPTGLYIKKAEESVDKLQKLINDLLDVSKINAGKLKFDMQDFDLGELVKRCIDNSRHIYPMVDITEEPDEDMPVRGNAERLEQVIMNLINNAVKYSGENKRIIIRTEKTADTATVFIIDFGIGIPAEDQGKIFDRFYRVARSAYSIGGLGMGLYISSEIIKEHKGTITVISQPGKGSTFSFSLPLATSFKSE